MEFKVKKIRDKEPRFSISGGGQNYGKYKVIVPILIAVFVIVFLLTGIVKALSSIDFTTFLSLAGSDLQTDLHNNTNFLLLGTGGGIHDGADLTDTIMIASLNHDTNLITLMSIPRDLYVKDSEVGSSRINEVFFNANYLFQNKQKAFDHLTKKIQEITGTEIHYYAKIDFQGFEELIDAIGGIDVTLRESIYDPFYPKGESDLYEVFSLPAGFQHLDGATALKYARSRKTTSDFSRAERQQQILYAIKEKALSTDLIFDRNKIEAILKTLKKNIDTNITTKEILTLGALAPKVTEDKIVHRLIHDDPSKCGGFLYPPERDLYGGAFVLIPAGGYEFLHLYSDLTFNYPEIARENSKIQILNGTKKGGVAGETKQILQRFCFEINRYGNGNSQDKQFTTYYYKQKLDEKGNPIKDYRPAALNFLQKLVPGRESTEIPAEYTEYIAGTDIILELGSDYTNSENYISDPFYSLPPAYPTTTATTTETTTETTNSTETTSTQPTTNANQ